MIFYLEEVTQIAALWKQGYKENFHVKKWQLSLWWMNSQVRDFSIYKLLTVFEQRYREGYDYPDILETVNYLTK
jgi:hypothetical protein